MKQLFFMAEFVLLGIFMISCSTNTPVEKPDIPSIVNGKVTPGAYMLIIKFEYSEQKNKVIVGHPIADYDDLDGQFMYIEDGGLILNVQEEPESFYSVPSEMAQFLEEQTHLIGTSPYINLTDGYYLVDWKWQDIMPLSALTNYAFTNAHHNTLEEHIRDHIFLTDLDWSELTDLNQKWDNEQYTDPVSVEEVYRISFERVDCLFDELKEDNPYACYSMTLYNHGLSARNAWVYYVNDGASECNPKGRYLTYLTYCDSLQEVYKKHLIEMIHNGQLK